MTLLTTPTRRPRRTMPPEYARASFPADPFADSSPRRSGGSGGGVVLEAWQYPPRRELRGVLVGARIVPKLCYVVS